MTECEESDGCEGGSIYEDKVGGKNVVKIYYMK